MTPQPKVRDWSKNEKSAQALMEAKDSDRVRARCLKNMMVLYRRMYLLLYRPPEFNLRTTRTFRNPAFPLPA